MKGRPHYLVAVLNSILKWLRPAVFQLPYFTFLQTQTNLFLVCFNKLELVDLPNDSLSNKKACNLAIYDAGGLLSLVAK